MLDPRIYRMGFVAIALAVVVLAFSLSNQPGPLGTTLAPDAFNGQNAFATMQNLAGAYPNRRPGSPGDDALAGAVAQGFQHRGFAVSTSIVVVAHRDATSAPAKAELSGTATLLELARVLSGETQQRTIVLASISGSAGAAGGQTVRASPRRRCETPWRPRLRRRPASASAPPALAASSSTSRFR
jgi:hypothetical protein